MFTGLIYRLSGIAPRAHRPIVPPPCRSVVPSSFRSVAIWPEAGELVISILNPHEGRKYRKGGEKTRRKTTTNALHRWKTENGKWQMENGKCVSDNCKQGEASPASSFSVRLSLSLYRSLAELLDKQTDRKDEIADGG